MKKTVWVLFVVLLLGALVLSACGGGGAATGAQRAEVPADYGNQTNPHAGSQDAVAQGQQLYAVNCASCHGETADGNGPVGGALDPKPANLQQTAKETSPEYSHWVIAKGGPAAGLSPSMVGYEGILSDDDIWKIVTYIEETYGN
jgi:mono/diheme cytochrome c family protein